MILKQEVVDVKDPKCVKNVGDLWNVLAVSSNYFVKHLVLKNISLTLVEEEVCMDGYAMNQLEK